MPTYVYKFLETGETIEVQQSFDEPTLTEATHPVTGATMAVKKVYLPVGVTFKGDGFYKTDSRSTGTKSGAGSSGSSESASPATTSESSSSGASSTSSPPSAASSSTTTSE